MTNRRVLLASHDATARARLSQILREAGYETVETADAAEAQELARVHVCDVVLLDAELMRRVLAETKSHSRSTNDDREDA